MAARKQREALPGMSGRQELMVGDGTPLDEAVSALIKELRRSRPVEALYWATQLHDRFGGYLWRRLAIFAAEDVSIANADAIVAIRGLQEECEVAKKKLRETKLARDPDAAYDCVAAAVYLLATTPKCRESNFLWGMMGDLKKSGWTPDEVALVGDGPATDERKMIAALEAADELAAAWFAARVEEATRGYVWRPLLRWAARYVAAGRPQMYATVSSLAWAYTLVEKGSGSKQGDRDCLSMAVMVLARTSVDDLTVQNVESLDQLMQGGGSVQVPEYALDGHTRRGKALTPVSRDRHRNWFMEWSRVVPNVGPHDVELWHLRRLATGGLIEAELVDQLAEQWKDEETLVDPTETRYPVIEGWTHP